MDRQRSFSYKSSRFVVFAFTVSSSVVFLTLFTVWLFKSTSSIPKETSFEFNNTALVLGLTVQTFTGLTINFTQSSFNASTLVGSNSRELEKAPPFASIPVPIKESESETLIDEGEEDGLTGNFAAVEDSAPIAESLFDEIQDSGQKVEEKKIRAISMENIEVQRSLKIADKTGQTSPGKNEASTTGRTVKKKNGAVSVENFEVLGSKKIEEKKERDCDVTKGKWVYDESYPLYTNVSCPFIDEGFDCGGNGRLDKHYMKWRWKPENCDIPRFNATKFLDMIRGKRLVFVGDSINRNQWESMLCMLMGAVKDPKRVYETRGRRITKEKGNYSFKFVDYQCTVEYYVSHFLVHETKARVGKRRVQTLRIDAIDHGSSRWRGADILIFNTAHWWSHFKTKAGINYYQEGNLVHPQLDVNTAFRRALRTWASWVDKNINPKKTRVFFRSSSPSHFRGGQWNAGGHCQEATQPLNGNVSTGYYEKNIIVQEIIKQMKTPVNYLNITRLSELRIDGHPSVYGRKPGKGYAAGIQDCSHWCLPGLPDTWNELLYFLLQSQGRDKFQ
ncbi:hypothetical protein Tsubulata_037516 [Turnera subulata]|uniref:Trichome birefringence-like N-terminal domain-containing protein n=1 Tax=Turnera subulata TaxID=218843 RepID=A0A9Q0JJ73_9ROSI|nr:hypothetical protein Tsubulata_037516 [Turnera subulata]